jgi:hypothetical protein
VDTVAKDAAIRHWCDRVTDLTGEPWGYIRVNQADFERVHPTAFADLIAH